MMKLLMKTMDKEEAEACECTAQKKYGGPNVYRFQYRANDGKFYYEVLWNIEEDLLCKLNKLSYNMCGMPYEDIDEKDQDMLYCLWEDGCIK